MAGMQVGCISVSDTVNVQAFVDKAKADKYVVESEQVGSDGRKYIPICKAG
jgi:hypothetical protein